MSRPLDGESRASVLIDSINHILVTEGIAAITIRRIAELTGVSTGAIMNHFGNRDRLIRLAAIRTVAERVGTVGIRFDGVHAFLPRDDAELPQVRAYLGWLEFWRVHGEPDGLSREIGHLRALLRVAAGPTLDPVWHEATDALVHGLLHATCRPAAALSVHEAHAVLADFLSAVASPEGQP